jgi:uncharacterized protein with NRDE domain
MGTWLGINPNGRLAAVTNYRETGAQRLYTQSRRHPATDFLTSGIDAPACLHQLQADGPLDLMMMKSKDFAVT